MQLRETTEDLKKQHSNTFDTLKKDFDLLTITNTNQLDQLKLKERENQSLRENLDNLLANSQSTDQTYSIEITKLRDELSTANKQSAQFLSLGKDNEAKLQQHIQTLETQLNQTTQSLRNKDSELSQTKQTLADKESDLAHHQNLLRQQNEILDKLKTTNFSNKT